MVLWWLVWSPKDYAEPFIWFPPAAVRWRKEARGLHKSVILAIWSISKYKVTLPSQQFCFAPSTASPETKLTLGSVLLLFGCCWKWFRGSRGVTSEKSKALNNGALTASHRLIRGSGCSLRALQKCAPTHGEYLGFWWWFGFFPSCWVVGFFAFRIKIHSLPTSCCFQSSHELSTVYWRMWQYKPHKMQLL